jgi:hypothetical protein
MKAVGLLLTSDHVLDEISVTGSTRESGVIERTRQRGDLLNDGDVVLGGLELPKSNVDGDTSLSLGLKFVKDPCVLEPERQWL